MPSEMSFAQIFPNANLPTTAQKSPLRIKRRLVVTCWLIFIFSLVAGCSEPNVFPEESRPLQIAQTWNFSQDIQPILDQKCVSCHACYDSPCQLNLQSGEGLDRGATQLPVYDGTRLKAVSPTRLGIDAHTTEEWRNKGFYSVLFDPEVSGTDKLPDASLLYQMLALGQRNPWPANRPIPEEVDVAMSRASYCPTPDNFAQISKDRPYLGMPFAVTGLTEQEFSKIATWIQEGAVIDQPQRVIPAEDQSIIKEWESFLNDSDPRQQLVARYLYEHLFLAHLYLHEENKTHQKFYRLIRAAIKTPQGQDSGIQELATVRPTERPEEPFHYKLVPIDTTIVYKTHITYPFHLEQKERYTELFLSSNWTLETLPDHSPENISNPFKTFAAIPAKARYQFLLDEAEYFVRTFIRGPVCHGPVATDVIRDQFWAMFENPDTEQYVNDPGYRQQVTPLLGLPGVDDSLVELGEEWLEYKDKRNKYQGIRQRHYQKVFPKGAHLDHIWDGDGFNDNAFLTIFRHHDSAAVTKGWQGRIPLTMWWMDYPLFERTYYELVANFDVFGNLSHQAQTRLYFDLIRNGSETNLLRHLEPESRESTYADWYRKSGKLKQLITYEDQDLETPGHASSLDELVQSIVSAHPERTQFPAGILQKKNEQHQQLLKLLNQPAEKLAGILRLSDIALLVLTDSEDKPQQVYSIIRDRAHTNVAFMFGEELRYEQEKDQLSILPGIHGSYPNFIFRVQKNELSGFVSDFSALNKDESWNHFLDRYGIRRTHPQFWQVLSGIHAWQTEDTPLQAGILDINRYQGW